MVTELARGATEAPVVVEVDAAVGAVEAEVSLELRPRRR